MTRVVPTSPFHALAPAAVLAIALGCGGTSEPDPVRDLPDGVYEIRGSIVGVDVARRIVEIDHEAIPGLMPAMTMPYEVDAAVVIQGLAPGDRVRGTLRVDSRGYFITTLVRG